MIRIDGKPIDLNKFPDGTFLLKDDFYNSSSIHDIEWKYESNEELIALIFLTKHLRSRGVREINLIMPYIPNARQDRVKSYHDVFTLKYFADIINSLEYNSVEVLDPHSSVSEALINNLLMVTPKHIIKHIQTHIESITFTEQYMAFYPDEGAMKRYSGMIDLPYAFGIKQRDWSTGQIKGLEVSGNTELIPNSTILIIDDICSRGGTFFHSAKKLKELGANQIYLYITHCENTILEGDLLTSGLIEKVFTTDSIFTKEHEKIEVYKL